MREMDPIKARFTVNCILWFDVKKITSLNVNQFKSHRQRTENSWQQKYPFLTPRVCNVLWCIGVSWSLTIGLGDEGNPWVIRSTQVCLRTLAPETRDGKREPDLYLPGSAA